MGLITRSDDERLVPKNMEEAQMSIRLYIDSLRAALKERDSLKQWFRDADYPCLPGCDSIAHEEKCPHVGPEYAWERKLAELDRLTKEIRAKDAIIEEVCEERDQVCIEATDWSEAWKKAL